MVMIEVKGAIIPALRMSLPVYGQPLEHDQGIKKYPEENLILKIILQVYASKIKGKCI